MAGALMKDEGQKFLEHLACGGGDPFESRLCNWTRRFGLPAEFTRNELALMYEAARLAARCNQAFNQTDEKSPALGASMEVRRWQLERAFMEARDILYASPGWQVMEEKERQSLDRAFLKVEVAESRLGF